MFFFAFLSCFKNQVCSLKNSASLNFLYRERHQQKKSVRVKNSASLNFLYREHINTLFSIIICKKANKLEVTVSVRVKKFCHFKFFVSRTSTIKPLLDNICKKANKLEAKIQKKPVSSSEKFCLFEFFVSRTSTIKPLLDNICKKANKLEAKIQKKPVSSSEKFCLFEFFVSRTH